MTERRGLARVALLAALAYASACAANAGSLPADPPFITGTVTAVGRVAEGWRVEVEERPPASGGTLRVVLHVRAQTEVRGADGARARAEDLREGQRVRAWITGPIMKSYPPQATPRLVVIDAAAP